MLLQEYARQATYDQKITIYWKVSRFTDITDIGIVWSIRLITLGGGCSTNKAKSVWLHHIQIKISEVSSIQQV